MDDLISRQAAIDAMCERCRQDNPDTNACDICDDMEILKNIPSAQPEIIRCKDCKHWREGTTTYSYCDKLFRMGVLDIYDYMTTEDEFCSNAERRTDEQID